MTTSLPVSDIILQYVCPGLGIITANVMFFAPYRDLKKAIMVDGELGNLNPTPWAFMLGNCCGWVTYSFLIQNLFVFFANCPGFILSVWLNMGAAKLQYESHRSKQMKQSLANYYLQKHQQQEELQESSLLSSTFLVVNNDQSTSNNNIIDYEQQQEHNNDYEIICDVKKKQQSTSPSSSDNNNHNNNETEKATTTEPPNANDNASVSSSRHENIVMIMVIFWVIIISIIAFGDFSSTINELIIGLVVNMNLIFFYGAPLSTIVIVIRSKSTNTIHIPTMITNTLNGAFWCAYGIAVLDYYIMIPNGLGALLGGIQIILCVIFPRTKATAAAATAAAAITATNRRHNSKKDNNDNDNDNTMKYDNNHDNNYSNDIQEEVNNI